MSQTTYGRYHDNIRDRLVRAYSGADRGQTASVRATPQVHGHADAGTASFDLAAIRRAVADMQRFSGSVGQLPPEPPTWRGRIGAFLIRLVQRVLFWYTPHIIQFHNSALRAQEQQLRLIESLAVSLASLGARLNRLEEAGPSENQRNYDSSARSERIVGVGASAIEPIRAEGAH